MLDNGFTGGEFVLLEQRPRAQSRAHVLTPPPGAFVIFPTRERPAPSKRGYSKGGLRHGVSTITSGRRTALGIIFHDARLALDAGGVCGAPTGLDSGEPRWRR